MSFQIDDITLKTKCMYSEPNNYTIPLNTIVLVGKINPELNITLILPNTVETVYNIFNDYNFNKSNIEMMFQHDDLSDINIDLNVLRLIKRFYVKSNKCKNELLSKCKDLDVVNLNQYYDDRLDTINEINRLINLINHYYNSINCGNIYDDISDNTILRLSDLQFKKMLLNHEYEELEKLINIHQFIK